MKFEKAILEKKVNKEDLPKGVQKKISTFEKLAERLATMEMEEMDEAEKKDFAEAKKGLGYLDAEIERAVLKFDPEIYKQKLDRLNKMNSERLEKARGKQKPDEIAKPSVNVSGTSGTSGDEAYRMLKSEDSDIVAVINDEKTKNQKIHEDLARLKETIKIKPEMIETPTEVEEFEKAADAKPKKTSKWLTLIGVGVFFMTWGAVGLFRERRL